MAVGGGFLGRLWQGLKNAFTRRRGARPASARPRTATARKPRTPTPAAAGAVAGAEFAANLKNAGAAAAPPPLPASGPRSATGKGLSFEGGGGSASVPNSPTARSPRRHEAVYTMSNANRNTFLKEWNTLKNTTKARRLRRYVLSKNPLRKAKAAAIKEFKYTNWEKHGGPESMLEKQSKNDIFY